MVNPISVRGWNSLVADSLGHSRSWCKPVIRADRNNASSNRGVPVVARSLLRPKTKFVNWCQISDQ